MTVSKVFFVTISTLMSSLVFSSDVEVTTKTNRGQGFFFPEDGQCYVITPQHVTNGSEKIDVLAVNRKTYKATLEKEFNVDISLFRLIEPGNICDRSSFDQKVPLSKLLKFYNEGVLKTVLSDGSRLQTKINIVSVDESEFLEIRPVTKENKLKQGYSGSVLFIANQPAGILLEVEEQAGYVYRSDALLPLLKEYFKDDNGNVDQSKSEANLNTPFEGGISHKQEVTYTFRAQKNSPLVFTTLPTEKEAKIDLHVLNARGKKVYQNDFWSNNEKEMSFTPKDSGTYTLQLIGDSRKHGRYRLILSQWALDSELRAKSNVLEVGDEAEGALAYKAVAQYQFIAQHNSPLLFKSLPVEDETKVDLHVLNARGKKVYQNDFWSNNEKEMSFTPKDSGTYTLQLVGDSRKHGRYELTLKQWAIDSELRSKANVLEVGDKAEGSLAYKAVAQYRFIAQRNSPLLFKSLPVEDETKIDLHVLDARGKKVYKNDFWSNNEKEMSFTPKDSGAYILQLTGDSEKHGRYELTLKQWALDSELRAKENVLKVGDEAEGALAYESVAQYLFITQSNSPLLFKSLPIEEETKIDLHVLDARGKKVYQSDFWSNNEKEMSFTPKDSGAYTLQLVGDSRKHGRYRLLLNQWALDSELRGEANILEVGDEAKGAIAYKSVAEYRFTTQSNSPLFFKTLPSDEDTKIDLLVLDARGKKVYQNDFWSSDDREMSFTPKDSGTYTLQLIGDSTKHGRYELALKQWALDSELRGEANILNVGDEARGAIAYEAVAEYHFTTQANSPLALKILPVEDESKVNLYVLDPEGKKVYEDEFWTSNEHEISFTPINSGVYTMRLVGSSDRHGYFSIELWSNLK